MRLVVLAFVIATVRSAAADDRADALWNEGQELYRTGRYEEAIERFERGRAIDPRPAFLYAQGQAARKLGDCRRAIELYRRFVVEATSPAQVEAARLQISRCEADLQAAEPTQPAQPAQPATSPPPAPLPAPPPPRDARAPWYRDKLGIGLAVGSAAALGVGTVFLVRSRRELDGDRASYGDFETALEQRQRDRVLGLALLGAGAALATGAALRFTLWPATVTVEGRF